MDINVGVSNHHVHLTREAVDVLFGNGYELTKKRELTQIGQFACEETVDIVYNNKKLEHLRVVGGLRNYTQVELLDKDCSYLEINAPIRDSGDLSGSASVDIVGPNGVYHAFESTIVANTHIHMSEEDLKQFNVNNKDKVKVLFDNGIEMDNVTIKSDITCVLELHINKDIAEKLKIETGDKVNIC